MTSMDLPLDFNAGVPHAPPVRPFCRPDDCAVCLPSILWEFSLVRASYYDLKSRTCALECFVRLRFTPFSSSNCMSLLGVAAHIASRRSCRPLPKPTLARARSRPLALAVIQITRSSCTRRSRYTLTRSTPAAPAFLVKAAAESIQCNARAREWRPYH